MTHVSILVLCFAVAGALAAQVPYIAWSVQAGNGCSTTKTVATFYFPLVTCYGNSTNSYRCAGPDSRR